MNLTDLVGIRFFFFFYLVDVFKTGGGPDVTYFKKMDERSDLQHLRLV